MLKNLRVTEIIGCKRALWYNNAGYKKDSPHPLGMAGIELHQAIQNNLESNEKPDFKYEINNDKYNKFLDIKEHLKIDYLTTESRYYTKNWLLPITGKPDLIKGSTIYDWKSAKLFRTSHELQLTGYYLVLKDNGIEIKDMCVIYLGNNYPMQIWLKPQPYRIKLFLKLYDDCLNVLNLSKAPYSEQIEQASFSCLFCDWFTECKKAYYE